MRYRICFLLSLLPVLAVAPRLAAAGDAAPQQTPLAGHPGLTTQTLIQLQQRMGGADPAASSLLQSVLWRGQGRPAGELLEGLAAVSAAEAHNPTARTHPALLAEQTDQADKQAGVSRRIPTIMRPDGHHERLVMAGITNYPDLAITLHGVWYYFFVPKFGIGAGTGVDMTIGASRADSVFFSAPADTQVVDTTLNRFTLPLFLEMRGKISPGSFWNPQLWAAMGYGVTWVTETVTVGESEQDLGTERETFGGVYIGLGFGSYFRIHDFLHVALDLGWRFQGIGDETINGFVARAGMAF